MFSNKNPYLMTGALLSGLAAIAHLVCIAWGANGYRFFGAGEQMAVMAEQGQSYPAVVTLVISCVLVIWSLYALAGAGVIRRLPLMRVCLSAIAMVYLARALGVFWLMPLLPENSSTFWLISSSICGVIGFCYALGTYQMWGSLSPVSGQLSEQ